jgi:hypothetical protein
MFCHPTNGVSVNAMEYPSYIVPLVFFYEKDRGGSPYDTEFLLKGRKQDTKKYL